MNNNKKSAAVILAAGLGSRMEEVVSVTNKCIIPLNGITPLEHTIKSFVDNGINHIIIVVGHYSKKVIESVRESMIRCKINAELEFITNPKYNYHGCEYSLSCASYRFESFDTIYITEGDLLLSKSYVSSIINSDKDNAVLIRSSKFIDKERSVLAIGENLSTEEVLINRFIYDTEHKNVYKLIDDQTSIRGESIQLWKFSGILLEMITNNLLYYKEEADKDNKPWLDSGLLIINDMIKCNPIAGIEVDGTKWINLNTIKDVNIAKSVSWLNR